MSEQKRNIIQIILAAAFYIAADFGPDTSVLFHMGSREITLSVILFIIAYFIAGFSTLKSAFVNIIHGHFFDENFLMTVASIGAFCLGEYSESVAVMLFFKIGETFEDYAVDNSRKSIAELMQLKPEKANLITESGNSASGTSIVSVKPEEVNTGDKILVKPGEKIPLDGVVIEGDSELDTSALTGESAPRRVSGDDEVLSGCINLSGALKIRVTSTYEDSTVSRILEMVEDASSHKAPLEKFITVFSRYYTPIICASALLLAFIPPLFVSGQTFDVWVYRALIFLVISCPCALVISIPLSFFGGVGAASREGILVKGSNYLEALPKAETVIFDKTGTITTGSFSIINLLPRKIGHNELIELAAYGEIYSLHPVAKAMQLYYGKKLDESLVSNVHEIGGGGISSTYRGKKLYVGNRSLLESNGVIIPEDAINPNEGNGCSICAGSLKNNCSEICGVPLKKDDDTATIIYIAYDGRYKGCIALADTLKNGIHEAIDNIKKEGVKSIIMLSGDRSSIAESVAVQAGIDTAYGQLMPGDKVTLAEKIISEKTTRGKVVFVGDGINDAPVIARADIGIAMGGMGSEAAIEAADIVIMDDDPGKISKLMKIAKRTTRIARQNVVFALSIKLIVLILGAMGYTTMWLAVFADVGVTIIAILNSMRAMIKRY